MKENNINFYTLNVGQGDSHVVHFPANEAAVVIDPFNSELINELLHNRLKIKSLPFILISHGDTDHMSQLEKVIKKCLEGHNGFPVKPGYIFYNFEVLAKLNQCKKMKKTFKRLRFLAAENNLKVKCIFADDDSSETLKKILDQLGIEGKILYPQYLHMIDVVTQADFNLASIVMLLTFANKKILYSGDLPYGGWKEVDEKENLKSDVFKVPHHGGKISDNSGADMRKILDRVNPNFALVSVSSENSHKHPLPEVIKTIVSHPAKPHLFCTQMTDQCSKKRHQHKEKVHQFYKSKLTNKKEEYEVLKLSNDKGTMCAGTIRITFNRNSEPWITPSTFDHCQMLNTFFTDDGLLCRPGTFT